MKLIVGLGNPGQEYEKSRHNVGFLVVDKLAQNFKFEILNFKSNSKFKVEMIQTNDLMLVKPRTFMNRSGEAVQKIMHFYGLQATSNKQQAYENLWIIHDDLDIKLGEYKIQFGRGPKVHNGVNSIREALGTDQFWYVRVGIDNRATSDRLQATGEEYVLKPFMEDERDIIDRVVIVVAEEIHGRIV